MRTLLTILALMAGTTAGVAGPRDSLVAVPALTVDQLLERSVRALGGRKALQSVRTRLSRGFMVNPSGEKAGLEIAEKAPDRFRVTMDVPAGRSRNGYDGTAAWSQPPGAPAQERPVADAAFVIREHRLDRPLAMRSLYSRLSLAGARVVGGRKVIVLEAVAADSVVESWSFDSKSWLPVTTEMTIQGTPLQTWFEDYRRVGGVLVPFRVRRARRDFSWTHEFATIEQNVPLGDTLFSKPSAP